MPFDFNKLPPAELFSTYFEPTYYYTQARPAALYRRNEASFGPETWIGLYMAGAAFGARAGGMGVVEEPVPAAPSGGGR